MKEFNQEDLIAFGSRVQKRRKAIDMTQEELATKMGYKSKSSINKIEKGLSDMPQNKIANFRSVRLRTRTFSHG